MKKIIIIIGMIFMLGITACSYGEMHTASEWAVPEIKRAIDAGLVPDEFRSDYNQNISREETCGLVFNLLELSGYSYSNIENPFNDTESKEIVTLYSLGIINGKTMDSFNPDDYIKREEAAKILSKMLDVVLNETDKQYEEYSYADSELISGWALPYVSHMYYVGILKGDNNNCFNPGGNITKEQLILTLYRVYSYKALEDNTIVKNDARIEYCCDDKVVMKKGKESVLYDIEKNKQICAYESMEVLDNKKILVKKEYNRCGVINSDGEIIIPLKYDGIKERNDCYIVSSGSNYGVINSKGNFLLELSDKTIFDASEKGIIVHKSTHNADPVQDADGKISFTGLSLGVEDYSGRLILNYEYTGIMDTGNGFICEKTVGGKSVFSYVDYDGETVLPFEYEYMICAGDVVVAYKNLTVEGMEMKGDAVCIMSDGSQIMREGVQVLESGNGISISGESGCEFIADEASLEFYGYEYVDSFSGELFSLYGDGKWHIADKSGTAVFKHNYDWVELNDGWMIVRKGDEYGVVDMKRLKKLIKY